MTTRALGVASLMKAIQAFNEENGITRWDISTSPQKKFFRLYDILHPLMSDELDLNTLISSDWEKLSQFLSDRDAITLGHLYEKDQAIGIVSVVENTLTIPRDSVVKVQIRAEKNLLGFELPQRLYHIYSLDGFPHSYLLNICVDPEKTLWIFLHDENRLSPLEMIELSMEVMHTPHRQCLEFTSLQIPKIEFHVPSNIAYLQDANIKVSTYGWTFIARAVQCVGFTMDDTGVPFKRSMPKDVRNNTKPFVVGQSNFYGWIFKPRSIVPEIVFATDQTATTRYEDEILRY